MRSARGHPFARCLAGAGLAALVALGAGCGNDSAEQPQGEEEPAGDPADTSVLGGGDEARQDQQSPAPGTDDSGGGRDRPTTSAVSGQTP